MKRTIKMALVVVITTQFAGCGGGGGSSSTVSSFVRVTPSGDDTYVSFSGGLSDEATYNYNTGTSKITSVSTLAGASSSPSMTYVVDSNNNVKTVTFSSAAGTSLSFNAGVDTASVLAMNNSIETLVTANGEDYILSANPYDFGWDYQTFGTWVTGAGTGSGTVGVASIGWTTSASSVPTTGTATYTGYTGGRYAGSDGTEYFTSSNLSASANFASRSIGVATTNTYKTTSLSSPGSADSNLNFTGTATYSAGSNQFSGAMTTGSGLTGTLTGLFYGPSAEEIGGTFGFQAGSGVPETYAGSFGAER